MTPFEKSVGRFGYVLIMLLTMALSSCGSSHNDRPILTESSADDSPIVGTVTDGPIAGARLYIDENTNGFYDEDDPPFLDGEGNPIITDSEGVFDFVSQENLALYQLVAHGGVDTVTGEEVVLDFTAPTGYRTLNPITSAIAAYMEYSPGTSKEAAEAAVEGAFGLPDLDYATTDLADDWVEVSAQQAVAILATVATVVAQAGVDSDPFDYIVEHMGSGGNTDDLIAALVAAEEVTGTDVERKLNDTVEAVKAAESLEQINSSLNEIFYCPENTFSDVAYNAETHTLTLTGTNMNTLLSAGEDAATDMASNFDWSKLQWDVDSDDTDNIGFSEIDILSVMVVDDTTLVITLSEAKALQLEAVFGFDALTMNDTIEVQAGFSADTYGNVADSDAYDGPSPDRSVVVFDLVHGVSSNHSGRSFDANTSYTIYVMVDFATATTTPTGAADGAIWGAWTNAQNLGEDDVLYMVGEGGPIKYYAQDLGDWVLLLGGDYAQANYLGYYDDYALVTGLEDESFLYVVTASRLTTRTGPGLTYPIANSYRKGSGATMTAQTVGEVENYCLDYTLSGASDVFPVVLFENSVPGAYSIIARDAVMADGILVEQRLQPAP